MTAPVNATDATISLPVKATSVVEVITLDHGVANVNPLGVPATNPGRTAQQTILPAAVKGRNVAVIQDFAQVDFKFGQVPNGSSIIFKTTTTSQGKLLESFLGYQIYVAGDSNGLLSPNNFMPEIISSASFPYYTKESLYDDNGNSVATSTNRKAIHTLQVRNNSGNTAWIGAEIYTKFIVNNSNAASN